MVRGKRSEMQPNNGSLVSPTHNSDGERWELLKRQALELSEAKTARNQAMSDYNATRRRLEAEGANVEELDVMLAISDPKKSAKLAKKYRSYLDVKRLHRTFNSPVFHEGPDNEEPPAVGA